MCENNQPENSEDRISVALLEIYETQSLIRFGALASDSCIIDDNLQLQKGFDLYILLRSVNDKLEKVVKLLS